MRGHLRARRRTADPIRRIVLGYDASPDADLALDLVARLPFRNADSVTVCTVYESVAPLASGIAPTMVDQVHAAYQVDLDEARGAAEAVAADGARRPPRARRARRASRHPRHSP